MSVRYATDTEVSKWDDLVLANPDGGNILQSAEMAEQKKLSGWQPRYIMASSVAITVLEKKVFGLGRLWYIIKGPGITSARELDEFLPDLKKFADAEGVFAIKIEPELPKTGETLIDFMKLGLIKVMPVQPNSSTVLVGISGDLDTVMSRLNQKGRHAIRRAERDGVTVQTVDTTDENCQKMFKLYQITAEGQFPVRPYGYYKKFWQRFAQANMGQMFFAYAGDQLVAAAYALVFGKKSTYKDGASVRERPVYGASHLLQWRVIEWAKSRGSEIHDLSGTPPSDQINDPAHPYYGIGRFKTSFNKEVTDFVGTYDIVIRPYRYNVWTKIGERLALRSSHWRRHESFY
jgi:lipid II:glycine glycyltransferase (peptidoglycan interpeptide bridge formation enzyme)